MFSKPILTLVSLAHLALGTLTLHTQAEGTLPMEHAQIQSTVDSNSAAVAKQDIEAILNTYAADAIMIGPGGAVAQGHPALRAAFGQFLAIKPKITVANSSVVQSGDVALHLYSWTMSGKTPDGHPIEQAGLSAIVLRKQANGRWLMVIDNPFADQTMKKP